MEGISGLYSVYRSDVVIGSPRVTWILPTNRYDELLCRAIDSCIDQTFLDFELIIIANGENAEKIASNLCKRYGSDPRVRFVCTQVGLINFSLNLGLHLARAPLVARMDADDISAPDRLEKQVDFMDKNPHITVLGSSYQLVDKCEVLHGTVCFPVSDYDIRRALPYRNPICHPAVMLRRADIVNVGGYLGGDKSEDYDLWIRLSLAPEIMFANLREPLLKYNVDSSGDARRSRMAYASSAGSKLRTFLVTKRMCWLFGCLISCFKSLFTSKR